MVKTGVGGWACDLDALISWLKKGEFLITIKQRNGRAKTVF